MEGNQEFTNTSPLIASSATAAPVPTTFRPKPPHGAVVVVADPEAVAPDCCWVILFGSDDTQIAYAVALQVPPLPVWSSAAFRNVPSGEMFGMMSFIPTSPSRL